MRQREQRLRSIRQKNRREGKRVEQSKRDTVQQQQEQRKREKSNPVAAAAAAAVPCFTVSAYNTVSVFILNFN